MHAQAVIRKQEIKEKRELERKHLRNLAMTVAAVGLLFIVVLQVMAAINRANADRAFTQAGRLSKTAENLELAIESCRDHDAVRLAAERMGLQDADPEQIRTIVLHDARINTPQMVVDAGNTEGYNG